MNASEFAKRLLDITLALAGVVLTLPLCLSIVMVLACTGEREIFYVQRRIGRGGRRFPLFKFATMLKNSPQMGTGTVTTANDSRVLPVGRFLRKTKLNELPQLWNIVRGDMSLVGPRPLAEQDFACYSPEVRAKIVEVRPGLTGIGSVVFRDEERILAGSDLPPIEAYRSQIAPRKGRLELWYIENRSLALDLRVLALTVVAVAWPRSRLHERILPGIPWGAT